MADSSHCSNVGQDEAVRFGAARRGITSQSEEVLGLHRDSAELHLGSCNRRCAPQARGDAGRLEGFQRAPPQMRGGRERMDEGSLKEFSINNFSK